MILPGSTIGILGGGQLGRMSALAGRRLGYRFHIFEPSAQCPAGAVAEREINAPYSDVAALEDFARGVDRITLEFENIPSEAVERMDRICRVFPGAHVLYICQNRRREKNFLRDNGFPCAPFAVVDDLAALRAAVESIGRPAVLKTAAFGYDGKGQVKIDTDTDLEQAWASVGGQQCVLEGWVRFSGEFSAICARNAAGETRVFPIAENIHRNHILHTSIVPARIDPRLEREARSLAVDIAEKLDVIGLIAVELFLTDSGWVVNELAPRPHNSGHYSFDACLTSQFEQHIRAICGLPLGDPRLLSPVVMVNLLGDLWRNGQPDWATLLREPEAKLHLYGKTEARPGRKMGHFCVLANTVDHALERARLIERELAGE